MTATLLRPFAVGAAPGGAFCPVAPAALARNVLVLEGLASAPPALFDRLSRLGQVVRPC